jgi:hypothetical protein
MFAITNKSAIAYEVTRIAGTDHRIAVQVGLDGGTPIIISRKLYKGEDGRSFVTYRGKFRPVVAVEGGTIHVLGPGAFVRGTWHFVDGIGWEKGTDEPDVTDGADDADEVAADAYGNPAPEDNGEFDLFAIFWGDEQGSAE